jgi:hypothetical protein
MPVGCLLWDFGDTLCDERFIWGSSPDWMAIYDTFDGGIGDRWCVDDLNTTSFAEELSHQMHLEPEAIVAYMTARSTHHIDFYDYTYRYFRSRQVPQAIVTVNPDLFSEVIVPAHDLGSPCETIVTSWEEHTIDKSILCRLALERMEVECEYSEALLIDNKQTNLEAWEHVGGPGYLYTTDLAFRRDVESGVLGLPPRLD